MTGTPHNENDVPGIGYNRKNPRELSSYVVSKLPGGTGLIIPKKGSPIEGVIKYQLTEEDKLRKSPASRIHGYMATKEERMVANNSMRPGPFGNNRKRTNGRRFNYKTLGKRRWL
jgi:hypothetical protein